MSSEEGQEEWVKEQVSGIWRIYHDGLIREDNEVCKAASEADADQIIRDHTAAREGRLAAERWASFMEWLTDQQVVHWTLTEETKDDPEKAVRALMQMCLDQANDPRISEVAAKAEKYDVAAERVRVLEGEIEFLKWSRLIDDSRRWSYEGDTELAVFSLRDSDVIKAMGEEMVALMWAYSRGGATHAEIREVCKQAEQFTRERHALLSSREGSTEAAEGNDGY